MSLRCSHCGDVVPVEEWHPVTAVRDDDGTLVIHDFCTDACRSDWRSEC